MKKMINTISSAFLFNCLVLIAWLTVGYSQQTTLAQESQFWPADESMFPGKGPLQKADWFKKLWNERRGRWKSEVDKDNGSVVFLGDSITQGWGSLAKDFPYLKVANRGISGDTTRQVLYRLKEDVISLKPTAIVLLIGTNDLGLGGNPEDAAENVKAILTQIKSNLPKTPVIVCKVMPRQQQFAEKIKRLNELVDGFIKNESQFIRCDTWGIYADENGGAKKEEFPDLLHPNSKGYEKWKLALEPIFEKLNLKK
ncbi:MAG: GDSL-type esterase/lipase family protein [Verrucomicrobiae bacterium]|nr:GDSL-type esterase/lipase family protein [Verrucomicrobiae bacterium]